MKKCLSIIILLMVLLAACAVETPSMVSQQPPSDIPTEVPPPPPSDTPNQAVEPTSSKLPEAMVTQAVNAYPEPEQPVTQAEELAAAPTPYPEIAATATQADPQVVVQELADKAILALKEGDIQSLSLMVHPVTGLRFSPYGFVREEDLFFIAAELPSLMDNPNQYIWGVYDGSGDPINLTFADYFARFVYDVDFSSAPEVSINQRLGQGSTIDNAAEFYPGAMIVEYHFPGFDEQYQGMDWRSLRLVFQEYIGRWVLVGIIHDEWTT